jgi:hypothetical protein
VTVADIPSDGNTRVAFVAAISNPAAPTTTELNLGILLQSFITADGLEGYEVSTSDVDNTALNSLFDTVTIGRDKYSNTMLRFKKQSGSDLAYSTLTRGTAGYIVIRRDIAETTAWATSQNVEVYPITCGQRRRLKPEGNTLTRWESDTKISSAPTVTAVIA